MMRDTHTTENNANKRRWRSKEVNSHSSRSKLYSKHNTDIGNHNKRTQSDNSYLRISSRKEEENEQTLDVPLNIYLSNYNKAIAICNYYFVNDKITEDNAISYKARLLSKVNNHFHNHHKSTLLQQISKYIDSYIEKELKLMDYDNRNKKSLTIQLKKLRKEMGLIDKDNPANLLSSYISEKNKYKNNINNTTIQGTKGNEITIKEDKHYIDIDNNKSRMTMNKDKKADKLVNRNQRSKLFASNSVSYILAIQQNQRDKAIQNSIGNKLTALKMLRNNNSLSLLKLTDCSNQYNRSKSTLNLHLSQKAKETDNKSLNDLLQTIIYEKQNKKVNTHSMNKSASSVNMINNSLLGNNNQYTDLTQTQSLALTKTMTQTVSKSDINKPYKNYSITNHINKDNMMHLEEIDYCHNYKTQNKSNPNYTVVNQDYRKSLNKAKYYNPKHNYESAFTFSMNKRQLNKNVIKGNAKSNKDTHLALLKFFIRIKLNELLRILFRVAPVYNKKVVNTLKLLRNTITCTKSNGSQNKKYIPLRRKVKNENNDIRTIHFGRNKQNNNESDWIKRQLLFSN